jgi:hypothetical protein
VTVRDLIVRGCRSYFVNDGPTTLLEFNPQLGVQASADWSSEVVTTSGTVSTKMRFLGEVEIDGALNHDGSTVGFYGAAPVAKQTGVPVTAEGIHAALVNLGLISA